MSKIIQDIGRVYASLVSEKQTERKQGAYKLELFLKEKDALSLLDENSLRKSRHDLTWDLLIQRVAQYNVIEIENVKATVSVETTTRKHKEVADLYQYVIQTAEKRGPRIKASHVFKHIANTLQRVTLTSPFVPVYTNILLKCILNERRYITELVGSKWQEILTIYGKMILASQSTPINFIQVIQQLLCVAPAIVSAPNKFLMEFFLQVFKSSRIDKNIAFIEIVLRAFNLFCQASATNIREYICDVAIQLFPIFCKLWKLQTANIRTELVEFFNLLLLAHKYHPASEKWTSCLQEMFGFIYHDFAQLSSRISISSTYKSCCQNENMVHFAAEVFAQLVRLAPVDQSITLSFSSTCAGFARKRNKLSFETPWEPFFQGVQKINEPFSAVAWLQVANELCNSHELLVEEKSTQLVDILQANLPLCKNKEAQQWMFKLIHSILLREEALPTLSSSIMLSCFKIYSIDCACLDAIILATLLWQKKLTSYSDDVFKLFMKSVAPPNIATLNLLKTVLRSRYFPEQLDFTSHFMFATTEKKTSPLRKYLLDWLLPDENVAFLMNDALISPTASIIVALLCAQPFCEDIHQHDVSRATKFTDIEAVYKIFSFHISTSESRGSSSTKNVLTIRKSLPIGCIVELLVQKIQSMVNNVLLRPSKETDVELCKMLEASSKTISFLLQLQVTSHNYLKDVVGLEVLFAYISKLTTRCLCLYERVAALNINISLKQESMMACLATFNSMMERYVNLSDDFMRLIPTLIIDLLLRICKRKVHISNDDFMDGLKMSSDDMFDDEEFMMEANDSVTCCVSPRNNGHPLKQDSLNHSEMLQLIAFQSLLILVKTKQKRFREERQTLLDLFHDSEDTSNVKLQMLMEFHKFCFEKHISLPPSEILHVTMLMRSFLSFHRFDQDVCCAILSGMVYCIQQLKNIFESSANEARLNIVQVLSVFWSMRDEKCSPALRKLLAENLATIIEVDMNESGHWKIEFENNGKDSSLHSPSSLFIELLNDESMCVRCYVARHLHVLFHVRMIKRFTEISNILLNIRANSDKLFATSALVALLEVMVYDYRLEKQVLIMVFTHTALGIFEPTAVNKALKNASHRLGYTSLPSYISQKIDFLIWSHLERNTSIHTFPSQCLEMTSQEFVSSYYKEIVCFFVVKNDFQSVKKIHSDFRVGATWKQLLIDSFVPIATLTLPLYCRRMEEDENVHAIEKMQDYLTLQVFNSTMQEKLNEFLLVMFVHIFDPPLDKLPMSNYTEPCEESIFYRTIQSDDAITVLTHLACCYDLEKQPISIFVESPQLIVKLLVQMAFHITTSVENITKLCYFRAYFFFAMFLLENLKKIEVVSGQTVIRELLYRCLYFIDTSEKLGGQASERITTMCFVVLESICKSIEKYDVVLKELCKHLVMFINKLQCYISKHEKSLIILDFLLIKCSWNEKLFTLMEAAANLDLLPNKPELADINTRLGAIKRGIHNPGLSSELTRVIGNLSMRNCPEQTLQYLKKFLMENHQAVLLEDEQLGTLIDCLKKTSCSSTSLAFLAIDCLGIIGPVTIHKQDYSKRNKGCPCDTSVSLSNNALYLQLHEILLEATKLTIDDCVVVSRTAVDCIENLTQSSVVRAMLKSCKQCSFYTYLLSFISKKKYPSAVHPSTSPDRSTVERKLSQMHLNKEESYEHWLKSLVDYLLVCGIVKDDFFKDLLPLCQEKQRFCRLCLPYIIHNILTCDEVYRSVFTSVINKWISLFLQLDLTAPLLDESKLKVLEIVNLFVYLRQVNVPTSPDGNLVTCWDNNWWMQVNYKQLAEIAYRCKKYFAAALFIEIWLDDLRCDEMRDDDENQSAIEHLSQSEVHLDSSLRSLYEGIVYDIYSSIGDVDCIYGAESVSHVLKRVQSYQHEQEYAKALLLSDVQTKSDDLDILQNLMKSGLQRTALRYLRGVEMKPSPQLEEVQYEMAWRNGIWDGNQISTEKLGFHGNIHQGLMALHHSDSAGFKMSMLDAKLCVASSSLFETEQTLQQFLSRCNVITCLQKAGASVIDGVPFKCDLQLSDNFEYYEPALCACTEALKIGCHGEKTSLDNIHVRNIEGHLKNVCKLAREAKQYEVAERCIHYMESLERVGRITSEWRLEEAKLFWSRGETTHAVHALKSLMNEAEKGDSDSIAALYPIALGLYGHWLGETRSQNPVLIMEKYLEPAIDIMEAEGYSGNYTPIEAYHSLAMYADAQYKGLLAYIKSPAFEAKQSVISQNKAELTEEARKSSDVAIKRHVITIEKQLAMDEAESKQTHGDVKKFLEKAVESYCKCLQCGDKYDLKVLRLCSLWFENFSHSQVNSKLQSRFPLIQSRKFLLVMYQLAARLGTSMTQQCGMFRTILRTLLKRCVNDHPHHTLSILLALCNGDIDDTMTAKARKKSGRTKPLEQNPADKARISAARSVLKELKSTSKNAPIIQNAERLALAYIELAYWDISHLKTEKGPFQIPESKLLRKICNLDTVAIPTVGLQVDNSSRYEDFVYICKFDSHFTHAGGVNLPKILTCLSSDGVKRRQLIKGRDDLRQDAVMQQVFGVVNILLRNDPETRKRELSIRTYKVVPLSRKSGLMEWCEGTVPLGDYLVGRGGDVGAHRRYYPNDWTAKECRKKLSAASVHDDRNSKHNVYLSIQRHFHPVFRHFFTERFKEPPSWFKKRLAYTRSTAAASIVGYVVGLGDRHVQNILIDCNTAEIVHIDLGVAFEQGKMLPTPEKVPFRLSRDIVDGMGVVGIEGVYRRCCEKSIHVMREAKEAILTIIEVLLYDPLSTWTVMPSKALQMQTTNVEESIFEKPSPVEGQMDRNKMAERVLVRLKEKLSGLEDGSFLSVHGQVNFLIQEARSTQNLCKHFPGWQPYL